MTRPQIIAIAGGSCSGKTRLAEHTAEALGADMCAIVRQDNYYLDYGGANPSGPLPNFDHPNAIDWPTLAQDLRTLKSGQVVAMPIYDFVTHRRTSESVPVQPVPVILVEGILLLSQAELLPIFDQAFFVECDEQTRLSRRIVRDVAERGRTEDSVRSQFAADVAPMHAQFVEPSKAHADEIVAQAQCAFDSNHNKDPVMNWIRTALPERNVS